MLAPLDTTPARPAPTVLRHALYSRQKARTAVARLLHVPWLGGCVLVALLLEGDASALQAQPRSDIERCRWLHDAGREDSYRAPEYATSALSVAASPVAARLVLARPQRHGKCQIGSIGCRDSRRTQEQRQRAQAQAEQPASGQ